MKMIVFHLMLTFRWLIVATSTIISGLMIFVLISSMFNDTLNQTSNFIITLIVAVFFGSFAWNYNKIIEKLAP